MFSIYTKNELAMAVEANAANAKNKEATAATAATGVTYGTDNPFGNGIGSATPFGIGTDTPQGIFATDTHTFNPLAALNPTQTFAQAQALAIPTIPVSPASFLQGVPSKIL